MPRSKTEDLARCRERVADAATRISDLERRLLLVHVRHGATLRQASKEIGISLASTSRRINADPTLRADVDAAYLERAPGRLDEAALIGLLEVQAARGVVAAINLLIAYNAGTWPAKPKPATVEQPAPKRFVDELAARRQTSS